MLTAAYMVDQQPAPPPSQDGTTATTTTPGSVYRTPCYNYQQSQQQQLQQQQYMPAAPHPGDYGAAVPPTNNYYQPYPPPPILIFNNSKLIIYYQCPYVIMQFGWSTLISGSEYQTCSRTMTCPILVSTYIASMHYSCTILHTSSYHPSFFIPTDIHIHIHELDIVTHLHSYCLDSQS